MRRISRTLGCLVIALAASASLVACRDAVTGQGAASFFGGSVEATSGVSGENPTGTVVFGTGGGAGPRYNDAKVSCLSVRGNTAIIGFGEGWVRHFGYFWVTGLIRIVDNGPSAARRPAARPNRVLYVPTRSVRLRP